MEVLSKRNVKLLSGVNAYKVQTDRNIQDGEQRAIFAMGKGLLR